MFSKFNKQDFEEKKCNCAVLILVLYSLGLFYKMQNGLECHIVCLQSLLRTCVFQQPCRPISIQDLNNAFYNQELSSAVIIRVWLILGLSGPPHSDSPRLSEDFDSVQKDIVRP